MSESSTPVWLKAVGVLLGNTLTLIALQTLATGAISIGNGMIGLLVVACIVSLLNLLVRPLLHLITLPLSLFTSILAAIIVNGGILKLTEIFTNRLSPSLVTLTVTNSWIDWLLLACALGVSNWMVKEITK